MTTSLREHTGDIDTASIRSNTGNMEPLPPGEYVVEMTEFEIKSTKKQDGVVLACVFKVLTGEHENRTVRNNYNIRNPSEQTQRIAMEQLKGLCEVTDVDFDQVMDEVELLIAVPFGISYGPQKNNPQYSEVKKVMRADEVNDSPAAAATQTRQAPAATQAKPAVTGAGAKPKVPAWNQKKAS